MTLRLYARDAAGDMVEIPDALDVTTLSVTEAAEEGACPISTIVLDDIDGTVSAALIHHKSIEIYEDEVYAGESAIFRGYIGDLSYARGQFPLARQITVSASDPNTVWQRRVMAGADCNRPAETDVARMQWLITTSEAGLIEDDTYLSTDSPVNMDKCDYRGQMMGSVADDCAQASGKNWWVTHDYATGGGFQIWYGQQSLEVYDSDLSLSNILSDIDNVSCFAISEDTTLSSDPSRIYSGVYLPYDGGAIYRTDTATKDAYARRDVVMPSANVKSRTKAIARAVRYLEDLDEPTHRITTSVILPATIVNGIRPGMRVQLRASHLPSYDTWRWLRVLSRTVAYWAPGQYELTLVLDGPGEVAGTPDEPVVGCGIPEGQAFHNYTANPYEPGPYNSYETGPTFDLDNGVYRLVIRVNTITRAKPRCFRQIWAALRTTAVIHTDYELTPNPGTWWFYAVDFIATTYYSDWFTVSDMTSTFIAWIDTTLGGSGGPASCDWDIWVECQ